MLIAPILSICLVQKVSSDTKIKNLLHCKINMLINPLRIVENILKNGENIRNLVVIIILLFIITRLENIWKAQQQFELIVNGFHCIVCSGLCLCGINGLYTNVIYYIGYTHAVYTAAQCTHL